MSNNGDIIEERYKEFKEIMQYLEVNNQISFKVVADIHLKKVLLLSAASYFEDKVKEIILNFVEKNSNESNRSIIKHFVKNKALERQYHTFFSWDAKNANTFFSLFGQDFKKEADDDVKASLELKKSIQDFLELGNLRNELVHENFAIYPVEKTAEEIYQLYRSANQFVEYLSSKLT